MARIIFERTAPRPAERVAAALAIADSTEVTVTTEPDGTVTIDVPSRASFSVADKAALQTAVDEITGRSTQER